MLYNVVLVSAIQPLESVIIIYTYIYMYIIIYIYIYIYIDVYTCIYAYIPKGSRDMRALSSAPGVA